MAESEEFWTTTVCVQRKVKMKNAKSKKIRTEKIDTIRIIPPVTPTAKTSVTRIKHKKNGAIEVKNMITKKIHVKDTQNDKNKKTKSTRLIGHKSKREDFNIKHNGESSRKKNKDNKIHKKRGRKKKNESKRLIHDPKGNTFPKLEYKNEIYECESILSHTVSKGKVVSYSIKWKGQKEISTESASRIHEDVPELCGAYWEKNFPSNAIQFVKNDTTNNVVTGVELGKTTYSPKHIHPDMITEGYAFDSKWPNKTTKWESEMKRIVAILPSSLDGKLLIGYIEWLNGHKTAHLVMELHRYCPGKLITFYHERSCYH